MMRSGLPWERARKPRRPKKHPGLLAPGRGLNATKCCHVERPSAYARHGTACSAANEALAVLVPTPNFWYSAKLRRVKSVPSNRRGSMCCGPLSLSFLQGATLRGPSAILGRFRSRDAKRAPNARLSRCNFMIK